MRASDVLRVSLNLALALLLAPTAVAAQGLTWTLTPGARWIEWDKALPFDDTRLLGGAMGIGLGRYVSLEAFHHEETGVSLFNDRAEAPAIDVAQSGARVTLAFGTGSFVPVVSGGASLLRFRAEGMERTRRLSLDYGGGLRFVLGERVQGEVGLDRTRYFFDAANLLDPATPTSDEAKYNLTLRAGLGVQLGRRSFDPADDLDGAFAQRYQSPFSGFALAIEPVIGRLDFDSATGLDRQNMVGIRAGVDFGSFFGLRAFHWWGTEDDFRTTNGFRIVGGEAQFTLSAGPGITPFLTGGAGQLHWTPRGNGPDPAPANQTAVVLGAGVEFNFGRHLRASISARDYILGGADLSADPDLGSVVDPDELINNWQVSAGLKLVLGGSGRLIRSAEAPAPSEPPPAAAPAPGTAPPTADGRTIIIPVPETGELYVRFGESRGTAPLAGLLSAEGAAIGTEQLREIIRDELRNLLTDPAPATADSAHAAALHRLEVRIDSLMRAIRKAVPRAVSPSPDRAAAQGSPDAMAPASLPVDRSLRETRFFTGFTTTGPSQILLGLATDIGPVTRRWDFASLIPSIVLGFGDSRPTYLAALSVEYRFRALPVGNVRVAPMASIGVGLFRGLDFEAIVPTFAGVTLEASGGAMRHLDNVFLGVQGVDFLNGGRFLVGLRRMR
ncbi:outer membrane protein [Gaopeijia maritima]|uniref:Outer membrane protein beta-barrel domain-containing protein n=1 Tax=Gaopeijia maritima TaxID=3119007 RepID=A0ABU9E7L7_9BACT